MITLKPKQFVSAIAASVILLTGSVVYAETVTVIRSPSEPVYHDPAYPEDVTVTRRTSSTVTTVTPAPQVIVTSPYEGDYAPITLEPVTVGSVTYVTGGIGEEEDIILTRVQKKYNLKVTNVGRRGQYLGDVMIKIWDRDRQQMVSAESGPIFLASMPPGNYSISVMNEGLPKYREFTIHPRGQTRLDFVW